MRSAFKTLVIVPLLTTLLAISLASCGGSSTSSTSKTFTGANQGYSTDDLYRFFAVAFGAAPGVTYMGQLVEAADWGLSIKEIVNIFTTKPQFTETYPLSMSNVDFATKLVNNVVGSSANELAKQEAINDIVSALSLPNWTRGDVIFAVFNNLAKKPESDTKWYSTAKKMANQVTYAKYFTETMTVDTTVLTILRNAIDSSSDNLNTNYMEAALTNTIDISKINNAVINQVELLIDSRTKPSNSFFNVSWSSTDSTKCNIPQSDSLNYSSNGSFKIPSGDGGNNVYALRCETGAKKSNYYFKLTTVMKVENNSHDNKNFIKTNASQTPDLNYLAQFGIKKSEGDVFVNDRSLAIGDFNKEGSFSYFFASTRKTGIYDQYLKNPAPIDSAARIYFLKNENGLWIDLTEKLLPNADDRYSCVSHSYSSVADFNGDGYPDIFVSCSGIDFSFGSSDTLSGKAVTELFPNDWQKILWEEQLIYMSQSDGTYKKQKIPGHIYGHHANAADVNGDGKIDVLTTSTGWGNTNGTKDGVPYFLMGKGDGTFTRDYSRLPSNIMEIAGTQTGIFWTYLVPVDGRIDVIIVAGKISWFKNPGNGDFSNVTPVTFPIPGYEPVPGQSSTINPLDIAYLDGYFYVNWSGGNWPGIMSIVKIDKNTMKMEKIFQKDATSSFNDGNIFPLFKFSADKKRIIPYTSGCYSERGQAQFELSKCNASINLK